ncbi:MAG: murein L,D-transpeptidase catalytic domain family protein [Bacteriovorax sp.]|nr:murein L,D-transpeptidase catalytic domain family protein [Bacteriovorax sp.]
MSKTIFSLLILLIGSTVKADYLSWDELQNQFNKVSKNPKAMGHVKCFFEKHEKDKFQLKNPTSEEVLNRCYAKPIIGLDSTRYFAIIDYLVNSDQERMFLIDRKTGEISKMAVAHGRYKAGFFNTKLEDKKNSIKEIKYYSNVINSMASSSGFFIAGQDFEASDFGRSLVIHGLEEGINDNACERDVVIHKHFLMTKSKAHMLSSGCLMVSPKLIDNVIDLLKGTADEEMRLQTSGSLVFIYSPREAAWDESSCPGNFNTVNAP